MKRTCLKWDAVGVLFCYAFISRVNGAATKRTEKMVLIKLIECSNFILCAKNNVLETNFISKLLVLDGNT